MQTIFRLLLAVDIEGYSARTPPMQFQAQRDLRHAMEIAARDAGLDGDRWLRQASGDGELIVLPDDVDIVAVVGQLAPALERALAAMRRKGAGEVPLLRVRLAVHYGALIMEPRTAFGPAGDAPVVATRLLDARPLRRYLALHRERHVALVVSEPIFREVVCSGFCALPPSYFRSIRMTIKGAVYQGHIYDPGRVSDLLTARAPTDPANGGGPSDDPGADLYQRALEQAQRYPPGYDVEAELGRLTDWMSRRKRP
ncbi:hypothetical protein [Actinomadura sp. 9N215]|uniref:hypothetical protein n=1 Tax=Actinomadura sp. 9N215 TaxID=3375150 RepID=UPI0037AEFB47